MAEAPEYEIKEPILIQTAPLTPKEAVDAVASVKLKRPHRRFGEMMKRLAYDIKSALGANYKKGSWQSIWPVATKIFSCAVSGWSLDTCKEMYRPLAQKLADFPMEFFDTIAEIAWNIGNQYFDRVKRKPPREIAEIFP
jgi:hypothetical protein